MKKPEGMAEPDWYDSPENPGLEQYWNGKYWSKELRVVGEIGPYVHPQDRKFLHKSLFRLPLGNDIVFIFFVILVCLSIFYSIKQDLDAGITLPWLITVLASLVTVAWVYFLFLLILIPRRIIDKKKGRTHRNFLNESENSSQNTGSISKISVKTKISVSVIALFLLVILVFTGQNRFSIEAEGEKYFEVQQRISNVINQWNLATAPLVQAIQGVSDGTVGTLEAQQIASTTRSEYVVIHNDLDDACSYIPNYNLSAEGEEGALAKGYEALRINCDYLPQESAEVLFLIKEQISVNGTQAKIDYHLNEINKIIEIRKTAVIDSIDAILPYANQAEKDLLNRLKFGIQ